MNDYCPHDCDNGWIELESTYGTPCPEHPPVEPVPVAEVVPEVLP